MDDDDRTHGVDGTPENAASAVFDDRDFVDGLISIGDGWISREQVESLLASAEAVRIHGGIPLPKMNRDEAREYFRKGNADR